MPWRGGLREEVAGMERLDEGTVRLLLVVLAIFMVLGR
jgi:hypothetical protein